MSGFEEDVERYRHELRVHCYRMLGSYDEAEDLVQETFLRAWRAIGEFEGRSSVRAWLYRIATNACIDVRRPRRVLPYQLEPASFPASALPAREDVPWLQPFPDVLLDRGEEPDAVAIRRETIELAFLIAIQHLPARQRAVLIFRDVLGWSARETAAAVDLSVAAVNSALQRARPVLREHLPPHRTEWSARDTSEDGRPGARRAACRGRPRPRACTHMTRRSRTSSRGTADHVRAGGPDGGAAPRHCPGPPRPWGDWTWPRSICGRPSPGSRSEEIGLRGGRGVGRPWLCVARWLAR